MKYFKVQAQRNIQRYHIDKETFDRITQNKIPFEQRNDSGQISQYAICPSCLNPIQIIGLSHAVKVSPHGKHTGKTIKNLSVWNNKKYQYCPYAKHSEYIPPNDEMLSQEIDKDVIELYDLLKEQFDRVVYVIEKELHIKCSKNFWEDALKSYVINKSYCYPWLSEVNLPYIFAFKGMQHMKCYRQSFENNSDIYNVLKKQKGVNFELNSSYSNYSMLSNKKGCYFNYIFRFTNHRQYAVDGKELKETMLFCIDNAENGETIFEKKISFDETFFSNLIYSKKSNQFRKQELLDIAERILQPLQQ